MSLASAIAPPNFHFYDSSNLDMHRSSQSFVSCDAPRPSARPPPSSDGHQSPTWPIRADAYTAPPRLSSTNQSEEVSFLDMLFSDSNTPFDPPMNPVMISQSNQWPPVDDYGEAASACLGNEPWPSSQQEISARQPTAHIADTQQLQADWREVPVSTHTSPLEHGHGYINARSTPPLIYSPAHSLSDRPSAAGSAVSSPTYNPWIPQEPAIYPPEDNLSQRPILSPGSPPSPLDIANNSPFAFSSETDTPRSSPYAQSAPLYAQMPPQTRGYDGPQPAAQVAFIPEGLDDHPWLPLDMVHQQSRPNHPPKWFLPDWSESVPDEDFSLKRGDYYEDQLAVSAKHHAAARNGRYNAIAGGSQPISTPANSSAVLHGGPERNKKHRSDNISSKEILVELPATRRRGRPRKGRKNGDQRPDVEASAIEKGTIKGAEEGKTKHTVPRASSIKMPWVVVTSTMGANIWPDTPTPNSHQSNSPGPSSDKRSPGTAHKRKRADSDDFHASLPSSARSEEIALNPVADEVSLGSSFQGQAIPSYRQDLITDEEQDLVAPVGKESPSIRKKRKVEAKKKRCTSSSAASSLHESGSRNL
ncbi:hypothetical protein CVT26_003597 [Gymnopilus dilepis]|uniref:Uncharacterized protein n=1 Tax=Gymnopilus dilepis TaxID=231916 RepID=A0A409W1U6_9AGAR|nr:hypothetical protein CVT26_003597 [Gymnopilus dilepis]